MRRLVELILALTDLAEAELAGVRLGIERLIGSALLMLAVFVFAVGGTVVMMVGVYCFLQRSLGTAGAATVMGAAALALAGALAWWLHERGEDDPSPEVSQP